jgi:hypothetical protein
MAKGNALPVRDFCFECLQGFYALSQIKILISKLIL